MNRCSLLTAAAILAAIGATSCSKPPSEQPPAPFAVERDAVRVQPGAPQPVRFDTSPAEVGPPLSCPPVTARVITVEALTAPSFAPLDGRVIEVKARLGDHVKQGDKLAQVRTGDLPALEHDLRAASLAIKTKQAIVDRLHQLVDARAASQNELLIAQSELDEARLTAQAAGSKLRSLSVVGAADNAYWIVAARSGTVVQLDAAPGSMVGPNKEKPVFTVADLDEVLILGDVAQKDATALTAGMAAEIRVPGSTAAPLPGQIETVAEVVDPDRQTVPVRVRVKNEARQLRPNAYVNLEFPARDGAQVVRVPAAAVVSDGAAAVVFVEAEPGVLKRRAVELGRQTKEKVEITSGLKAGERVVVTGALLLLNALDVEG